MSKMIVSTTPTLEGKTIVEYRGLVTGQAVMGANFVRDIFAAVRDFVGGRAGSYEKVLRDARDAALDDMAAEAEELGANAIVGVDLDYESVGQHGSILMVTASGTAVTVR